MVWCGAIAWTDQGGFSYVYIVEDVSTLEEFALKRMLAQVRSRAVVGKCCWTIVSDFILCVCVCVCVHNLER